MSQCLDRVGDCSVKLRIRRPLPAVSTRPIFATVVFIPFIPLRRAYFVHMNDCLTVSGVCPDPGEGACPSDSCEGYWSSCAADCSDRVFTIVQEATGSGMQCSASHGDTMRCMAGEDLCPPDINCVGQWSSCNFACVKEFSVSIAVSGQGAVCSAEDGDIVGCTPGEGNCPEDIDCLGSWSTCQSSCADRIYTHTRSVVGMGTDCAIPDGATEPCRPGQGDCPPDVDCIGAWSECDSSCERTYTVSVPQSGEGLQCETPDLSVEVCEPANVCNDGDVETMNDVCLDTGQCEGTVTLAAQLSYDISAENLPAEGSVERLALENDIVSNLATVLTASGMTCTPEDVVIIAIRGGSVIVDYTVSVSPAVATPEARANAPN